MNSSRIINIGWFASEDAVKMITQSNIKKEFEDALGGQDVIHFDAFRRTPQATEFLSSHKL